MITFLTLFFILILLHNGYTYSENNVNQILYNSTNSTQTIQNTLNIAGPNEIYISNGTYLIHKPIQVQANQTMVGDGVSTILKSDGNHPIMYLNSTGYKTTVRDIEFLGYNPYFTNNNCLVLNNTNHSTLDNLDFYSCYHAIDLQTPWEDYLDHINIGYMPWTNSSNYIGIFTRPPIGTPNSSISLENSNIQNTISDGIHMEYFDGSVISNVQVGAAGGNGLYFGGGKTGYYQAFLHVSNVQSDSNAKNCFVLNGTDSLNSNIEYVQMSNIWAASCTNGILINIGHHVMIDNLFTPNDVNSTWIKNSDNVLITNQMN